MNMTKSERFLRHVNKTESCWIWIAYTNKAGYGQFNWHNKMMVAHRASWLLFRGDIPSNICVCHHCDNPSCVNPDHLFLATQLENIQDMVNKHRQNGHALPGEGHGQSKLTNSDVLAIRAEYVPREVSTRALAIKYGVSRSTISHITKRQQWKHI